MLVPRHPGGTLSGEDSNPIAHPEFLIFLLGDGNQLSVFQPHRDFHSPAVIGVFLDIAADDSAHYRAGDRSRGIRVMATAES